MESHTSGSTLGILQSTVYIPERAILSNTNATMSPAELDPSKVFVVALRIEIKIPVIVHTHLFRAHLSNLAAGHSPSLSALQPHGPPLLLQWMRSVRSSKRLTRVSSRVGAHCPALNSCRGLGTARPSSCPPAPQKETLMQ